MRRAAPRLACIIAPRRASETGWRVLARLARCSTLGPRLKKLFGTADRESTAKVNEFFVQEAVKSEPDGTLGAYKTWGELAKKRRVTPSITMRVASPSLCGRCSFHCADPSPRGELTARPSPSCGAHG